MTGYSDIPLIIVTLLPILKGVTVSEDICTRSFGIFGQFFGQDLRSWRNPLSFLHSFLATYLVGSQTTTVPHLHLSSYLPLHIGGGRPQIKSHFLACRRSKQLRCYVLFCTGFTCNTATAPPHRVTASFRLNWRSAGVRTRILTRAMQRVLEDRSAKHDSVDSRTLLWRRQKVFE